MLHCGRTHAPFSPPTILQHTFAQHGSPHANSACAACRSHLTITSVTFLIAAGDSAATWARLHIAHGGTPLRDRARRTTYLSHQHRFTAGMHAPRSTACCIARDATGRAGRDQLERTLGDAERRFFFAWRRQREGRCATWFHCRHLIPSVLFGFASRRTGRARRATARHRGIRQPVF